MFISAFVSWNISGEKENQSQNPIPLIKISPNPVRFRTDIKLNLSQESPVKLEVFDVTGKKIKTVFLKEKTSVFNSQDLKP